MSCNNSTTLFPSLYLSYLHKEKRIIHRDLTPNNVMLGENDHVTITDFGLAKVKQSDASCMTSVVGTILYSCPGKRGIFQVLKDASVRPSVRPSVCHP